MKAAACHFKLHRHLALEKMRSRGILVSRVLAGTTDDSIDPPLPRNSKSEPAVMDDRISIVTPDHVELDFEPAGVGSRLLALIVDAILIGVAVVVLMIGGIVRPRHG